MVNGLLDIKKLDIMERPKIKDYKNISGEGAYDYISDVNNYINNIEAKLEVTNKLLIERQKLLDAIPECNIHGKCVPNALEWIEKMKNKNRVLNKSLETINNIMWESYMIKDRDFGRKDGLKIMIELEKWASDN